MNNLSIVGLKGPFLGLVTVLLAATVLPELLRQPQLLGFVAASCTTLSFLPQVIHTLKTKNTDGISLTMYMMFLVGIFCWLMYGVNAQDLPLIIGNGITLILASVVFGCKLKSTIRERAQ